MLNMFNFKDDDKAGVSATHMKNVGDARKRLRWQINNPPDDLARRWLVTPDMADAMLERNSDDEWHNRPGSEKGILRYSRAMQRGWKFTGEPIIFSKSGRLLNGQHRLMACVRSGVSFETLVVFGIDDDAFKFMDIGVSRSAGHIFAIEDVPNYNIAAAIARLLFGYMASSTWEGRSPEVENDALLAFYYQHPRIQDSIVIARKLYADRLMPYRWAGMCHYICAAKHRAEADKFFEQVASGIGFSNKNAPAYKLRSKLLASARSSSEKLSESTIGAYTIKAWNADRHGEGVRSFVWRTAQTPNEPFPRAE